MCGSALDAVVPRSKTNETAKVYPITIIGPEIWAKLPPMPAFEPMPTVDTIQNPADHVDNDPAA